MILGNLIDCSFSLTIARPLLFKLYPERVNKWLL